jgi:hypothetical protein
LQTKLLSDKENGPKDKISSIELVGEVFEADTKDEVEQIMFTCYDPIKNTLKDSLKSIS